MDSLQKLKSGELFMFEQNHLILYNLFQIYTTRTHIVITRRLWFPIEKSAPNIKTHKISDKQKQR